MDNREIDFEIKSVDEAGSFSGIAAVFGNVDLGGDRIEPGAFRKTTFEKGGKVPLFLDHRTPIGMAFVNEVASGLNVKGRLNLDKEIARETLSDLRFYRDNGMPYGMSIGYRTIKSTREGEVRVLKEIALEEVTVTISPMNLLARVQDVKRQGQGFAEEEFKAAFTAALKEIRVEIEFDRLVKTYNKSKGRTS
jgi:uncharacterized protein